MSQFSIRALTFCLLLTLSTNVFAQSSQPLTLPGLWDNSSSGDPGMFETLFQPEKKNMALSLGLNGAAGNSETFSWLMGVDVLRKAGVHTWNLDFDYAQVSSNSVNTQKFARANLDYDRAFEDGSPWSYFAGTTLLADAFRDFDLRLALFNGVGHKWIDTDDTLLMGRLGFGTSSEIGGADDEWKPELLFGVDYRKTISDIQECGVTVDYFPNVTEFSDYRLVTDIFWQIQIKNPDFYLRLSAIDNYDSTPGSSKSNDLLYGAQLLWKTF